MSYTSLPLEPRNEFTKFYADQKYTYLIIGKVEKPARRSKKTEDDYKTWEDQQQTLLRLETGHYNCYNRPMEPCDILSDLEYVIGNFGHYLIYKIKPTSSFSDDGHYYSSTKWKFFEFDVIQKIETIEDLYRSLYKDYIMHYVVAKLINYCKYTDNIAEWDGIWATVKTAVPDIGEHLYFSDILRSFTADNMESKDVILRNLLAKDEIKVVSEYDVSYGQLLETAFTAGLYKSMLLYTIRKLEVVKNIELLPQDIVLLQRHTDNPDVAELVKVLKPKFPGMKLVVKKTEYYDDGYASREYREEIDVKDANEAKMYIARNFDVDFSELQRDINKIEICEDDVKYTFELMTE